MLFIMVDFEVNFAASELAQLHELFDGSNPSFLEAYPSFFIILDKVH
jgi:hypothetical protein